MLRIEVTEFLANFSAILTLEIQGYWSEADTQIRKIDKLTNGVLLSKYPEIEWRRIMTFRTLLPMIMYTLTAKLFIISVLMKSSRC